MRDKRKYSRGLTRGAFLLLLVAAGWLLLPDRLRRRVEVPALAAAMTFIVNTTDDSDDGACNVAHCSLREAINAANANVGDDTINFNIPGAGVHTIAPASALPDITDSVTIDGYSQPGASPNTLAVGNDAVLLIELNGAAVTDNPNGLRIVNGSNTVKGLVINRFRFGCITIFSDGNVIEGNFLGTDPSGTNVPERPGSRLDIGNIGSGVSTSSKNNTFGGTTPAARNLISGNEDGVSIGNANSTDNKVLNNYIGTNASGTAPLGNLSGVRVGNGRNNTIGGSLSTASNLIAFNEREGILIGSNLGADGNVIAGNSIHSNGRLGIDLALNGETGVTPNDAGDGDDGPNDFQNFPVVNSIQIVAGNANIQATLNTEALLPYRIELFSNRSCDPAGHGEGEKFHLSPIFFTDGSGNATFNLQIPVNDLIGPYITMTATGSAGTSEFSQCVPVAGTPIPVNTVADTNDGVCDSSNCTLREAIAFANLSPSLSQINFDIPGTGVQTINLLSALPMITAPVIIDGYSQPGSTPNTLPINDNAHPLIELNGAGAGNVHGLDVEGGSSVVRGLVINRFSGAAIRLSTKGDNVITGNFLGTDFFGTTASGNGLGVLILNGSDNRVGGLLPEDRNLISANADSGVSVSGVSPDRTVVQGNYIGVGAIPSVILGNGGFGVRIQEGSHSVIGGNLDGEGNVISGNGEAGLQFVDSHNNRIRGT